MTTRLTLIMLLTATLVSYASVRSGRFVYEDGVYLSFAQRPLTVQDVLQPRGLTILSFRLNGWLHGLDPQGYHAVNVGLFLMLGLVFFGFARTLLPESYALVATGFLLLSPIQSEAVAYISGRAEIIAAIGTVLAVWALSGPVTWTHAGLAFLATTLAIGGKEIGLMAIPLIALHALVIRRVPLLHWRTVGWALLGTLSLAVLAWPIVQVRILGAIEYLSMSEYSGIRYLCTQSYALLVHLGHVLWSCVPVLGYVVPSGYTVDHDFEAISKAGAITSAVLVGLGLALTWAVRRRWPLLTFGVWWIIIALLPRFFVRISELVNEHQIMVPFLGVWLLVAAGVQGLNTWLTTSKDIRCDDSSVLAS